MSDTNTAAPARPRLRRTLIGIAGVVAVLVAVNTVLVDQQSTGATEQPTVPAAGQDLHYRDDGPRDAPPLVLIHGFASSTRIWDAVEPALAASHRVVRVDLLGHGRSAKPAGDEYGMRTQAQRVAAVLDHLGISHAIVVGHSTGGLVATSLAEQRHDLVRALALVDTGPSADAFVSDGIAGKLLLTPVLGELLWRLRTDDLIRSAAATAFSKPGFAVPPEVVDDANALTYHALSATSNAGEAFLAEESVPDRLRSLNLPLLVVFGQDDKRWHSSSAQQYRAVPGATVTVLQGIGHSVIQEDPAQAAELLLAFAAAR
jgi:pimeloyl-ACP methyl ester carboxylesterase